ncbi:hypothetical protein DL93DRAFT_1535623 [Clavulina sp. PMI_390]|nr:hypothetical protein DL93DRAFT_1535623 [Clavulina sp. PMI_390]
MTFGPAPILPLPLIPFFFGHFWGSITPLVIKKNWMCAGYQNLSGVIVTLAKLLCPGDTLSVCQANPKKKGARDPINAVSQRFFAFDAHSFSNMFRSRAIDNSCFLRQFAAEAPLSRHRVIFLLLCERMTSAL